MPSPTMKNWRGKSSTRGPTTERVMCSCERKDGARVHSLAELKGAKSQRLGTEAGSVADYSLRQRGYLRRLFRNQLATLKALNDGDIDYAYLWANVGWTLHASPDFNLKLVPDYVPEDHWNIAVAMCRGDDELKRHIDAALDALIKDGTVARVIAGYHVPYFAPFPGQTGGSRSDAGTAIHHGVADRGPEPRMQKIQTSKHGYSGLARVRSAGELVVAMDQNNLPFSSAHPEPAGLDYAIAGLLAKQLGVRLRVYWAIAAHDSYRSKLSVKGLCDVILGIIPDARFEQRVLFSRPYYDAKYQLVVRSGEDPPAAREPVAVEQGVAVHGLDGRPVRLLSQHRRDSGSRRAAEGESRLRDLDTGCMAGPGTLAGKARSSSRGGIRGPLSHLRGRAKNRR